MDFEQIKDILQTPVGLGIAAVLVILAFLIVRKVISILFLVLALATGGWAAARYYDIPIPFVLPSAEDLREAVGRVISSDPARSAISGALQNGLTSDLIAGAAAAVTPTGDATIQMAERVKAADIAFNAPARIDVNVPTTVRLAIDTKDLADFSEVFKGLPGEVRGGEADLTRQVSAALDGSDGLEIRLRDPQRKVLAENGVTTWTWEVTPRAAGTQSLTLRVFAHPFEDAAVAEITRFEETIEVKVSPVSQVIGVAQSAQPAFGLIAAIFSIGMAAWTAFAGGRK